MISLLRSFLTPRYCLFKFLLAAVLLLALLWAAATLGRDVDPRGTTLWQRITGSHAPREALVIVPGEACAGAPFILPAAGTIGLLYADPRGPYSTASPHQGIDIFSPSAPGETPVYAAYDGYVTREEGWRSTLIMRVPEDPLQPGRQIWLYYTHMADAEGNDFILDAFPAGTREQYVARGTLLGYTGNYNGESAREIWVHLHFSIVQDDGQGNYNNELAFANTLDPSPYLGMGLNYRCNPEATGCVPDPTCG